MHNRASVPPTRLVFAGAGVSKQELARYFELVSVWMLPHLAGRPLRLTRYPRTIRVMNLELDKRAREERPASFHEWSELPLRQAGARRAPLSPAQRDDVRALATLALRDVVEIYTSMAVHPVVGEPDQLVFGLDPGPDVAPTQLCAAANWARAILQLMGLDCWPKLTGTRVLQLVVPTTSDLTWPAMRAAGALIASAIVRRAPAVFSNIMPRAGRVLIDDGCARPLGACIAPYSPRAREDGAVAVPVAWSELSAGLLAKGFTLRTLLDRMETLATDPWEDRWSCRQSLRRAVAKI